jgi:beta/gamma crystallin
MFRTAVAILAAVSIAGLATTAQAGTLKSYATDFSSQNKNKKPVAVTRTTTTVVRQPRTTAAPVKTIKRQTTTVSTGGGTKKFGGAGNTVVKQKTVTTTTANPNIKVQPVAGAQVLKFAPGPGQVSKVAFKPAPNAQFVKLGQFSAPVWKSGPKKIWWGNKWKVFIPITALGVVVLGGAYYYPDAYLTTSRYYCEGISPDGCRLNWQRVDFEDGDSDWQCVQFCRRPGAPPPSRTVALVAPPPPPQGGACEISIYSEPGFGGTNAQASTEQAQLSENGWQNQIASIKVKSGTWDFFSDQGFTGETMRLSPGEYPNLGPEWTKKAGSFMCVQQ